MNNDDFVKQMENYLSSTTNREKFFESFQNFLNSKAKNQPENSKKNYNEDTKISNNNNINNNNNNINNNEENVDNNKKIINYDDIPIKTNNINNNNNNNIYISNISQKKFNSSKKSAYGKYKNVLLTDNQLEQLKQEYSNYEELIDRLDKGIETYGYKYNNHYLAIKAWEQNKKEQNKNIHISEKNKHNYKSLEKFYI